MDTQLEEMRQQLALLKEKLDKQEIINDQLMRKAVGTKLRKIKIERWRKTIFFILALLYIPALLYWAMDADLWFTILTVIYIAIAAAYDTYYTWGINDNDLQNKRLLEMRERIIRMKRMNTRWLWFSIPVTFIWFGLFVWEAYNRSSIDDMSLKATPLIIGGLVGGLVGGIIGAQIYRKQVRRSNELIDEIGELTK